MTGLLARFKLTGKLLTLMLLALTTVLAACGGGGATAPTAARSTILRVTPAPGKPNPDLFNPFFDTNGGSDFGAQGLLFETLYFVSRYDNKETPWLASSYAYSSDLTSLTFTLNSTVKWNDGQAFTSADVLFSFQLMQKNKALDANSIWAILKDVSAPSPSTITFTLKQPDSTAVYRIGGQEFIVPQHVWQNITGDPAKFTNDNKPVGTGPYLLTNWNAQLVTYKVNPSYWGTKPQVPEIQVPSVKDNTTAITNMIKGQLDWLSSAWDPKYDTSFLQKDPTHNHHWFAASNTVMLYLNLQKAPFNNLLVRKAISTAINRDQLPQGPAEYAKVANPTGVITPTLNKWIAPKYQNATFTYSTDQAKTYLQQAGYTMGSDNFFHDKSGKVLSLKLNVVNGWTDWDQDSAFIAKDLQAAGIQATVNTQADFTPYFDSISTGKYDAALSWTNNGPTPFYPYHDMLSSVNSAKSGGTVAGTNFGRWDATTSNGFADQVDKSLLQYSQAKDITTQETAMANIEQIMVEQLPAIPLTVNVYWDEYTSTNWTGWPDANNPYVAGAAVLSPDSEYVILHLHPAA